MWATKTAAMSVTTAAVGWEYQWAGWMVAKWAETTADHSGRTQAALRVEQMGNWKARWSDLPTVNSTVGWWAASLDDKTAVP